MKMSDHLEKIKYIHGIQNAVENRNELTKSDAETIIKIIEAYIKKLQDEFLEDRIESIVNIMFPKYDKRKDDGIVMHPECCYSNGATVTGHYVKRSGDVNVICKYNDTNDEEVFLTIKKEWLTTDNFKDDVKSWCKSEKAKATALILDKKNKELQKTLGKNNEELAKLKQDIKE